MRVTVIGSGYVGLVTGACLADVGNQVLCFDVDIAKIERLKNGEVPIFEPGLDKIIARNVVAGRLKFTTDKVEAARFGLIQMLAVGTPPGENGEADLKYVTAAAKSIAENRNDFCVVVDKSTVPVGTADKVQAMINETLLLAGKVINIPVVSNPEFLKEGAAIEDFMKPDRIVIGVEDQSAEKLMRQLYEPFQRNHDRTLIMTRRSAELTKYAANAMLATRISFMNELSRLAEGSGADIEDVRRGIGSDPRIGYSFLYAGTGYGGSCFPKDVSAAISTGRDYGVDMQVLKAVELVNSNQKRRLFEKAKARFGDLKGRQFGIWGLAFKPNTDDMRDAPSLVLIQALLEAGAQVLAYDPVAGNELSHYLPNQKGLTVVKTAEEVLKGSDALFVVTEWSEFRSPDFQSIKETLLHPVIFDGRNMYEPDLMSQFGFEYYGIGRGLKLQ